MRIMVITASPNKDGLTATCGFEACRGVVESGAEVVEVSLNDLNIGSCSACNNGWGTCRDKHKCQVVDDFQKHHESMDEMDGFIIITPVYWGEMSESAKAFTDRVRRSEATNTEMNKFHNKPVICVAAAGGTGNGLISCLASMERFVMHVRGVKFDLIGINRNNREYTLKAIYEASKKMAAVNK